MAYKTMAQILNKIEKEATKKKYIVNYNGEKCFDYYNFTEFCHSQCNDTNSDYGFHLRDIVMEKLDPKFSRLEAFAFLGMNCID